MTTEKKPSNRDRDVAIKALEQTVANLKHRIWNLASATQHLHLKIRKLEKQNVEKAFSSYAPGKSVNSRGTVGPFTLRHADDAPTKTANGCVLENSGDPDGCLPASDSF